MDYLLAIVGLGVLCIAWYGVQCLTGREPPTCQRGEPECDGCEDAKRSG